MEFPPLRALFLITTKGVVPLNSPDSWSSHFQDFMNSIFTMNSDERPSAEELVKV
jgi:hypothetical protein